MKEEWKAVPGYENLYYVSNLGRMLVKRRTVERIINTVRSSYELPDRILSGTIDDKGYVHVRLTKSGLTKLYKIHNLVVRVFLGDYDSNIYDVHHVDGNKSNNRLDNLIILTKEEHRKLHDKLGRKRFTNKFPRIKRKVKRRFRCVETR